MFRAGLFRIAVSVTVAMFLGGGGWALREAWPAYLAVGAAMVYGVFLVAGRPATILRDGLVRALLDSLLVAVLIASTGGGGSPFFVLYPLAALGVYWIPGLARGIVGAAAILGGYLAATVLAAGDLGALLSAGVGIRAGSIVLFGAVGGFIGTELRGALESVRKLSSGLETEQRYEKKIEESLVLGSGPVLRILSLEGILGWTAETASGLLGAPYAHAATLEGDHRTAIKEGSDVYPSWWHPKIQRLVLWSYRTGEVLRDEETVHDLKGFMAVPVVSASGEQLATVVVGGKEFGAKEERALKLLARGVASALEGVGEAPGGRDPVSGLPNHASLRRFLRRELSARSLLTILAIKIENLGHSDRTRGSAATDALLEELGEKLGDGRQQVYHYGGDEFVAVLTGDDEERASGYARGLRKLVAGLKSDPVLPLAASVGFVATGPEGGDPDLILEASWGALREARRRPEKIFGLPAGDAKEPEGGTEAVWALVTAVEVRDPYLAEHSRAVSEIAQLIASRMGLPREQSDALAIGALLHDVGKIAIPDSILHKPGPLTEEEYGIIKRHPVLGAKILGRIGELSAAVPAVRHHHEWFDGRGYPDGLRGEEIPLLARITVAADAFDSMTRDRGYQRGVPAAAALTELERNSGTQFDPGVVAALVRVVEEETDDRRSGFAG